MSESGKVTIPVGGMHCQNCVNAINKKVLELPGVTGVEVDLGKGQAVVRGDKLDVAGIRSAIEELGFDAGDAV